ncbi:MAG: glycosyltransferase family 9 protein, partial [Candidatus Omnitrophota bacterium]
MEKIYHRVRMLLSQLKRIVKQKLLQVIMRLYPNSWHEKKHFIQDTRGANDLISEDSLAEKFFIILEMAKLKDKIKCLVIESGWGIIGSLIKEKGCFSSVIGFNKYAIEQAKEKWPGIEFINIDPVKFCPRDKFERIFMVNVAEHLPRKYLMKLLKKCFHWLADDGVIIIHTLEKNQESNASAHFYPEHINLLNAEDLKNMFEKLSFKIENMFTLPKNSSGQPEGIFCRSRKRRDYFAGANTANTLIEYSVTLGDTVCLTGVAREYKKTHPNERIFVKTLYPELFYHNSLVEDSVINIPDHKFGKVFKIDYRGFPERRTKHLVDVIAEQININLVPETRIPAIFIKDYEENIFERRFKLSKSKPIVVLAPHSRWASRNWIEDRWKKIGEYLIDKYDVCLIQVGQNSESYLGVGNNWLGLTDARTLAILLKKSFAFVSVDNGIHHLGAAVGTPGIVLFGPVYSKFRAYKDITYPVEANFGCRGCFHKDDWPWQKPPR